MEHKCRRVQVKHRIMYRADRIEKYGRQAAQSDVKSIISSVPAEGRGRDGAGSAFTLGAPPRLRLNEAICSCISISMAGIGREPRTRTWIRRMSSSSASVSSSLNSISGDEGRRAGGGDGAGVGGGAMP
jgi:hypothetical protein